MPYTQSVLEEQLKKGEFISSSLPWKLFSLSLTIFILLAVLYLGINFGYKPYLVSQVKKWETNLLELSQSIDSDKQQQLLAFYSQSANIKTQLDSKQTVSGIFNLIENNTYPSVSYNSFKLDIGNQEIKLEGVAPNYETIVKELTLFERNPDVEKVILENYSVSESQSKKSSAEFKFALKLILKKQIFKIY